LKSSQHQLLDSGIKNNGINNIPLKKLDVTLI